MRRFRTLPLTSLTTVALGLAACGSDDPRGNTDSDDTVGTTVDQETGDETDTGGTTGGETDMGTETGGEVCLGIVCGDPGVEECCDPASEECLEGSCLAACESGVRCGDDQDICCESGEVCINPTCTVPGADCGDSYDCMPGEFCEPTLEKCLPQFDPNECEVQPDFGDLELALEWSWDESMVISLPLIADINDDGINEVIIVAVDPDNGGWEGTGELVALDGESGAQLWRLQENPPMEYGANGRGQPALADVDGDGVPEVIYSGRPDLQNQTKAVIYAVNGDGELVWASHDANNAPHVFSHHNGAIAVANFDNDPNAEIVVGATLIDHDGLVVWDQGGDGALIGTNGTYKGSIPIVVDLDNDDRPEIVTGQNAWKVNWQPGPNVNVIPFWDHGPPDGYPAAADIDMDGDPEVILVAKGKVSILNGATGQLWCGVDNTDVQCVNNANLRTQPIDLPGGGRGGAPTVADFDGDGRPEIGVAGGSFYTVFDVNRAGEMIVQPMGDLAPGAGDIFVRWRVATQDESSNVTGSSVFDFQGDGPAEAIYGDECYLRVYDGSTGGELLKTQNSSATIHEYPVVADVDRDGNAELLVVANDYLLASCTDNGYVSRRGIYVYGDKNDQWVPTRRIWTQHSYHVTDATSDGNVPVTETANWTVEGLNNYRQNAQGEGVFNAVDLTVDLSVDLGGCPDELTLSATVRNVGTLGVPKGVLVSFYRGADASGELIASLATIKDLLPGSFTTVSLKIPMADLPPLGQQEPYYVAIDEADLGQIGEVIECVEDNNEGTINVGCPNPG